MVLLLLLLLSCITTHCTPRKLAVREKSPALSVTEGETVTLISDFKGEETYTVSTIYRENEHFIILLRHNADHTRDRMLRQQNSITEYKYYGEATGATVKEKQCPQLFYTKRLEQIQERIAQEIANPDRLYNICADRYKLINAEISETNKKYNSHSYNIVKAHATYENEGLLYKNQITLHAAAVNNNDYQVHETFNTVYRWDRIAPLAVLVGIATYGIYKKLW